MPDESPLDSIRRNEAIDELLDRTRPRLRRVLWKFQVPPEDAEDILHESLVLLVERWETIRNPLAWLIRVLSNRCVMYWRRRRSPTTGGLVICVEETTLELLAGSAEPVQDLYPLRLAIAQKLDEAPELHRNYLLGRAEGHSARELADAHACAPATVRRYVSGLRRRLRDDLGVQPGRTAQASSSRTDSSPRSR